MISQIHGLVSQVRLPRWRESLYLLYVQCCHLSRGGSNLQLVCHTTSIVLSLRNVSCRKCPRTLCVDRFLCICSPKGNACLTRGSLFAGKTASRSRRRSGRHNGRSSWRQRRSMPRRTGARTRSRCVCVCVCVCVCARMCVCVCVCLMCHCIDSIRRAWLRQV